MEMKTRNNKGTKAESGIEKRETKKQIVKNTNKKEEMSLSQMLDSLEEDELLKISSLHEDEVLPLPNYEKLAWSVIDKAELADEEELKRRKEYKRRERKKKIIISSLTATGICALLVVLYCLGVFDSYKLPMYSYSVVEGYGTDPWGNDKKAPVIHSKYWCYEEDYAPDYEMEGREKSEPKEAGFNFKARKKKDAIRLYAAPVYPKVDYKKVKNSINAAYEKYCKDNDTALDKVTKRDSVIMQTKDGKYVMVVEADGWVVDYKKSDHGKTWYDLYFKEKGKAICDTNCMGDESYSPATTLYGDVPIYIDDLKNHMSNAYMVNMILCLELDD